MKRKSLKKYSDGGKIDPPKPKNNPYSHVRPILSEFDYGQIASESTSRTYNTKGTTTPTSTSTTSASKQQISKSVKSAQEIRKIQEEERKARIADAEAAKKIQYTLQNFPEVFARETQAIGDKLQSDYIPDILNPALMLGELASGLGRVPLNLQQGKYGEAALNIGMPLATGALAGLGTKNVGQFANNIVNPLAGTSKSNFKSEIDWSKWNKEIPDNPQLMKEYNTIEQQAKANGTWMKNSDGSTFKGTPEQFVQQNSSNFKKSYPDGFENVYRGVQGNTSIPVLNPEKSIFTADYNVAKDYSGISNPKILNPFNEYKSEIYLSDKFKNKGSYSKIDNENLSGDWGVFNLAHKKSLNSIELDNFGREWTSVDLTNPKESIDNINLNIKNLEKQIEAQKNWLKTGKQNSDGSWFFPDSDVKYSDNLYKQGTAKQEKILQSYKDRLKNINQLVKNPKALEKMKLFLGDKTTTDDIAKYIEDANLDYVKIKNVDDSGLGDVSIVNHKKGNYLKSLVGNNGMFDMTNPNIFKALIPASAAAIGVKSLDKKEKGGMIKRKGLQSYNFGGEFGTINDPKSGVYSYLDAGVNAGLSTINPALGAAAGLYTGAIDDFYNSRRNDDGSYKNNMEMVAHGLSNPIQGVKLLTGEIGRLKSEYEKARAAKINEATDFGVNRMRSYAASGYNFTGNGGAVMANGGKIPNPQYEVEKGEVVEGEGTMLESGKQIASDMMKVTGETHENGGVKGKGGERVFSNRIEVSDDVKALLVKEGIKLEKGDKTYGDLSEKLGKLQGKYEENVAKSPKFSLANKSSKMMLDRIEMLKDKLFEMQEAEKTDKFDTAIMANGGYIKKLAYGANEEEMLYPTIGRKKEKRPIEPIYLEPKLGNVSELLKQDSEDYGEYSIGSTGFDRSLSNRGDYPIYNPLLANNSKYLEAGWENPPGFGKEIEPIKKLNELGAIESKVVPYLTKEQINTINNPVNLATFAKNRNIPVETAKEVFYTELEKNSKTRKRYPVNLRTGLNDGKIEDAFNPAVAKTFAGLFPDSEKLSKNPNIKPAATVNIMPTIKSNLDYLNHPSRQAILNSLEQEPLNNNGVPANTYELKELKGKSAFDFRPKAPDNLSVSKRPANMSLKTPDFSTENYVGAIRNKFNAPEVINFEKIAKDATLENTGEKFPTKTYEFPELTKTKKGVDGRTLTNALLLADSLRTVNKLKTSYPVENYRPNYQTYRDRSQVLRNSVSNESARAEELIRKGVTSGSNAASSYANIFARKNEELNKINLNELTREDAVTNKNIDLSNAAEAQRVQLKNALSQYTTQAENEKISAKNLATQTFVEGLNAQSNLDAAQRIEVKNALIKAYSVGNTEVIEHLKKSMGYKGTTEEFLNDFMTDNQKNSLSLPSFKFKRSRQ